MTGGRIRIQIILFWIYKYGTISVTIIYNNKYDSRINPGNQYKDIRRGTSVTIRLPGQRKLIKKAKLTFNIIIRKNKRGWPSEFDKLCTRSQSCSNTISHILG